MNFLNYPEDPEVVPLDCKVDRYVDAKAAGTW